MYQITDLANYFTLIMMVSFLGGMVTIYLAIQLDKVIDLFFIFIRRKYLDKDRNQDKHYKES
ncbi:hypothetical protein B0182_04140 [Moraxella bovis]|nr:hypothetical protein B0182_04140 [Moraxella bovis]